MPQGIQVFRYESNHTENTSLYSSNDLDDKKLKYTIHPNPESDSQERIRLKRIIRSDKHINVLLNVCATCQLCFALCFVALGSYLTMSAAWGHQFGANFFAALCIVISCWIGYSAARTKSKNIIWWNCCVAWFNFGFTYLLMFLLGLFGAFLSLHPSFFADVIYPRDNITLLVHGGNTILATLGFVVTLIQATIKTNNATYTANYAKTVSPIILAVHEATPETHPHLQHTSLSNSSLVTVHQNSILHHSSSVRKTNARATFADVIIRV